MNFLKKLFRKQYYELYLKEEEQESTETTWQRIQKHEYFIPTIKMLGIIICLAIIIFGMTRPQETIAIDTESIAYELITDWHIKIASLLATNLTALLFLAWNIILVRRRVLLPQGFGGRKNE